MQPVVAPRILSRSFYSRPTLQVARDLLGKILVREHPVYGRMTGEIVETEAYLCETDKACHGRFGLKEWNKVMFGEAGHAYVFFSMGIHYCLNVVTESEGVPAAVLIRACEPLKGIGAMEKIRGKTVTDLRLLTTGPGRLCKSMGIDLTLNYVDMCDRGPLYIEDAMHESFEIGQSKRIGVQYAGEYAEKPWRFFIRGNPFVSKWVLRKKRKRTYHKKQT